MNEPPANLDVLGEEVKANWHRFLDVFEPIRPELYRYCRYLARGPWDAEDLVQDSLMRAFVTLGRLFTELPNPRAWLFRVASNLWIDRMRRARFEIAVEADEPPAPEVDARSPREAVGTLLVRLSPHERAAVVLKDVFDFSLEEVADVLSTTPNAVKAALHRGRGKLVAPEEPTRMPEQGALDALCSAFNARDLDRMTKLLLESATVEIVGLVTEYGQDAPRDPRTGSFAGSIAPLTFDDRGGVAEEHLAGYLAGTFPRCEVRLYRGEPVLLFWFEHESGPAVRCVITAETEGDRVALVRNYFFSPDVIAEVCSELGVPFHANGYRYWPAQR